jgi:hypothetical protein
VVALPEPISTKRLRAVLPLDAPTWTGIGWSRDGVRSCREAICTGQTVVKGDAIGDTQLGQSLALGGEGLGVGGAACVAIRVLDMIGV